MILFRSMGLEDLSPILQNDALKPLLTVAPKGEKWGIVLEIGGSILGGITGYYEYELGKKRAYVQCLRLVNELDTPQYRDGMLRSAINKVDLEEAYDLFCPQEIVSNLRAIGFRKTEESELLYLNTKEFFSRGYAHEAVVQ